MVVDGAKPRAAGSSARTKRRRARAIFVGTARPGLVSMSSRWRTPIASNGIAERDDARRNPPSDMTSGSSASRRTARPARGRCGRCRAAAHRDADLGHEHSSPTSRRRPADSRRCRTGVKQPAAAWAISTKAKKTRIRARRAAREIGIFLQRVQRGFEDHHVFGPQCDRLRGGARDLHKARSEN